MQGQLAWLTPNAQLARLSFGASRRGINDRLMSEGTCWLGWPDGLVSKTSASQACLGPAADARSGEVICSLLQSKNALRTWPATPSDARRTTRPAYSTSLAIAWTSLFGTGRVPIPISTLTDFWSSALLPLVVPSSPFDPWVTWKSHAAAFRVAPPDQRDAHLACLIAACRRDRRRWQWEHSVQRRGACHPGRDRRPGDSAPL